MRSKITRLMYVSLLLLATSIASQVNAQTIWTDSVCKPDTTWYNDTTLSVYILTDAQDLAGLSVLVNNSKHSFAGKTIELGNDIDLFKTVTVSEKLDTVLWQPIGAQANPFRGIFDGKDFTIQAMLIKSTPNYTGLFGYANGAEIKNVKIGNASSIASSMGWTGAIAGKVENTVITNCHNYATINITAIKSFTGGLVGDAIGVVTTIYNCSNHGTINSMGLMVGGIAGRFGDNKAGVYLYNCYNTANLSSRGTIGGLVGMLQAPTADIKDKSVVANCYNSGNITSSANMAGGIVASANKFAEIKNCLSYGLVSAVQKTGGIVARPLLTSMLITRNYYLENTVTGETDSEKGTALSADSLYNPILANELTGFAGYENKTNAMLSYNAWIAMKGAMPQIGDTKAANADTVKIAAIENGKIEIPLYTTDINQVVYMAEESVVSPIITADSGYKLKRLTVDGTPTEVKSTTFTMGTEPIEVGAMFAQVTNVTIDNATELAELATVSNSGTGMFKGEDASDGACYLNLSLSGNISLKEVSNWIPIGTETQPFAGNFDGANYTIDSMTIKATTKYSGLFGYVSQATIENIRLSNNCSLETSEQYAGMLVGYVLSSTIKNCHNAGMVTQTANKSMTGGLIGVAHHLKLAGTPITSIQACSNSGNVTSPSLMVGGIVGYLGNNNGQCLLSDCLNTGTISAKQTVGGIVGMLQNKTAAAAAVLPYSIISNSQNAGMIISTNGFCGGIAGSLNSGATIKNSINVGYTPPIDKKRVGAIAGSYTLSETEGKSSIIENNYYDKQMLSLLGVWNADLAGTMATTTTNMVGDALKTALGEEKWTYTENMYPTLKAFDGTDIVKVASAPIFLANDEQVDSVFTNFTVSTANSIVWKSSGNITFAGANATVTSFNDTNDTVSVSFGNIVRSIVLHPTAIYAISATSSNDEYGTVSGAGSFIVNKMATLTAEAKVGYKFVNWTENNEVVSSDSIYSFAVAGNRNLVANFMIDNTDINDVNGAKITVRAHNNKIVISNIATDTNIMVFSITGYVISNTRAISTVTEIEVPQSGLYVVRINGKATKVVVQ